MDENEFEELNENDRKSGKGKFLGGLLTGALLAVLITGVALNAYYGRIRKADRQSYDEAVAYYEGRIREMSTLGEGSANPIVTAEFAEKVGEIYDIIDSIYYFSDKFDVKNTQEQLYSAIMDSIDDKYSEYYTVEEWKEQQSDSSGTYYGIGSYVTIDTESNYPMLSGVFEGSPAQAAGLRDGDLITEVEGENVNGWELTDVVNLIRGPENTDVTVTILRGSEKLTITVTRGEVHTIAVNSEIKRDNIGYIQITQFIDVASEQFVKALDKMKSESVNGIIIDLRSNPGGNLSTVLDICEQLLPKGRITYIEDRFGNKQEYNSTGRHEIKIPMVVLTNGYSASASELMTGALRDYEKATIIGTKTFGKGIVQSLYELEDESAIKITTASYFTPKGECIHGTGIEPDIEVEFDSEAYYDETDPVDNQLEYAIDYLAGRK